MGHTEGMAAYAAILAGFFLLATLGGWMPWFFGIPVVAGCLALSYWLTPKNQYVARYK